MFADELAIDEQPAEGFTDGEVIDAEELLGLIDEKIFWESAMPRARGFPKGVAQTRRGSDQGVLGDAEFAGDKIGTFKANSRDISGERVGIGADDFYGIISISFENAHGAAGADAVGMEEDDDGADRSLFIPSGFDSSSSLRPDAVDRLQFGGRFFDDGEDIFSEVLDHFFGVDGADSFDHPATEIFFDAFAGGWRGGFQKGGT